MISKEITQLLSELDYINHSDHPTTYSRVLSWLREEHSINIYITQDSGWVGIIQFYKNELLEDINTLAFFEYEEAIESSIKIVLEILSDDKFSKISS
jgi:hypothetical protein